MNTGPRTGAGGAGFLAQAHFLECDYSGHVVWMSETTRSQLGSAADLAAGLAASAGRFDTIYWRFTRVLEWRDSVVICAEMGTGRPDPVGAELYSLLRLQARLLDHITRLQVVQVQLAGRVRQRRGGAQRLVEQLERERQRIGRDLHTGVGQSLAAIRLQLELIARQMPEFPAEIRTGLERISVLAGEAMHQVRSVSHRIHPPEWQYLTLTEALRQLWELSGIPERFEARLALGDPVVEPPHTIKVLFYRAAQEAIANLIQHAQASRVDLALTREGDRLKMTVEDNGKGFDPVRLLAGRERAGAGLGLRSLREQVDAAGGELRIHSGPDGTELEVVLPLTEADEV